jgi:hypothetical protein
MVDFHVFTVVQVPDSVPAVSNKPNHEPCQKFLQGLRQRISFEPCMIATHFVGEDLQ